METQAAKIKSESTIEMLRKSEEIFRLLTDTVEDYAIFAIDTDGTVVTWNKGAERLKGYTAVESIGQNISKFYTPEDRAADHHIQEVTTALKVGRYEEEGWRVKKDGSMFWANVILTPLRDHDGNHIGFTKVTRDLTERKKAEDAMRAEEEKFRTLVETVKDYAILMLDAKGHVTSWNEGARRFKGYEAKEILGQHFSKFYPAEDVRAKKPEMELEVAEAIGRFEDEGWRVKKDGSMFWANVVITALYDKDRKLTGFSKVTRDLSERKRNEEKLREAYANLEARVVQKTSQLEAALKSREEFISIASHELKTPLTGLKMQVQMAKMRLSNTKVPLDTQKQILAMTVAEGQINRITKLIDDLLDISRIQAGKLEYAFEKANFSELFNEVIESFGALVDKSNISVKTFIDPLLEGYWDRARIEQVLINLLSNAIKYAPGSDIVVFAKQEDGRAVITIQDFGPGISETERGKIFERFERLGQTRSLGGLGLGLYISKQIVEAHGGSLSLRPPNGPGAVFAIEIPLDSRRSHA